MNGGGACEPVVLLMQAVTGTSDRVLTLCKSPQPRSE